MDLRTSLAFLLVGLLAGCSDDGASGGNGGDDRDDGSTGSPSPGGDAGGGSGGSGTGGPAPGAPAPREVDLSVAAVGAYPVNPSFDPSTASVPAGALVHVTFTNSDLVPLIDHNWVVEGVPDAGSPIVGPGESADFDFTAPATPGSFAYYCSLGDHRDRGMDGTLTVS